MSRDPEGSPCIGICELDNVTGLCRGCLRSGEEIAAWPAASPELRCRILRCIEERREAAQADKPVETAAR